MTNKPRDPEIEAMRIIAQALKGFDFHQKRRVLCYIVERYLGQPAASVLRNAT